MVKLLDGKRILVSEFEKQNSGGYVIQYGEEFYYVFDEYNYVLKTGDGIRIYRLGENAAAENILIKYLPEDYIWKTVLEAETEYEDKLTQYIDNIKDMIESEYLDNGTGQINMLYGDETNCTAALSTAEGEHEYGKVDFANIGLPVYLRKILFIPDISYHRLHLKANFFIYDTKTGTLMELKHLAQDGLSEPELIQMWFKEIGQKTFTFRIYHVSSYNYIFNVSLIEGNMVTQIRTDILSPKKNFVLTEGEIFRTY